MSNQLEQKEEKKELKKKIKSVSFSQLSMWLSCPHLHYLTSITKEIPWTDNVYTAYGKALEDTLEKILLERELSSRDESNDYSFFYNKLIKNLSETESDYGIETIEDSIEASKKFLHIFENEMDKHFGNYKLIETQKHLEIELPIEHDDYIFKFNGYIDLIIKDEEENIWVLDLKTTSRGWSKKFDFIDKKLHQLSLYKLFLTSSEEVDMNKIKLAYVFFKTKSKELEILEIDRSKEDILRSYQDLLAMVNSAYKNKFYNKNPGCNQNICKCKEYYDNKEKND